MPSPRAAARYYVVWRESQVTARYTTFVDSSSKPHAFTLDQLDPAPDPTRIAATREQFEALRSRDDTLLHPDRAPRIAVDTRIAQEVLGWPA